jgi:hypothetical protein
MKSVILSQKREEAVPAEKSTYPTRMLHHLQDLFEWRSFISLTSTSGGCVSPDLQRDQSDSQEHKSSNVHVAIVEGARIRKLRLRPSSVGTSSAFHITISPRAKKPDVPFALYINAPTKPASPSATARRLRAAYAAYWLHNLYAKTVGWGTGALPLQLGCAPASL